MSNVSNNEFSLILNLNLSRFKRFKSTKRTVYTVRLPVIKTIWCNFVAVKQTTCGISIKAAFRNLQRELWHGFSSQQDRNQIAKKSSRAQIPWEVPQGSLRVDGRSTLLLSQQKNRTEIVLKWQSKGKSSFHGLFQIPLKIAANVATKIASWINLCKRPLTT